VFLFPGLQVRHLDPMVPFARAFLAHVHDHAETDELLDGDLLGRVPAFEETDGGVEVGPPVLCGAELASVVDQSDQVHLAAGQRVEGCPGAGAHTPSPPL
jgi:hypothetical protein